MYAIRLCCTVLKIEKASNQREPKRTTRRRQPGASYKEFQQSISVKPSLQAMCGMVVVVVGWFRLRYVT